ncbi:MAG: hypothetical protein JST16_11210 [Bdellovibrionales bacterium]|nr:hypothetical protein [Bdellovibrionales bacterium]
MLYPLSGLLVVAAWLLNELIGRRQAGLRPSTWREFYRLGLKKNASDPRVPAAIFAVGALFVFAEWESVIRFFVGRENNLGVFVAGLVFAVLVLIRRRRRLRTQQNLDRYDVFGLLSSWTLVLGSWMSLVLLPWVFFRTRKLLG